MLNEEDFMWSVVGTWPFFLQRMEKTAEMLADGAKTLDALGFLEAENQ